MNKVICVFLFALCLAMCKKTQNNINNDDDDNQVNPPPFSVDLRIFDKSNNNYDDDDITETFDFDELSVELNKKLSTLIFVSPSEDNKFIGYVDLHNIFPEIKISDVYIYEKYIVLQEAYKSVGTWFFDGFNVYVYDNNIKYSEYKLKGKKLYSCSGEPYQFQGIYDDLIFFTGGRDIVGVRIIDLAKDETVLEAGCHERFSFYENVVSGLVISEWDLRFGKIDDQIKDLYKENKLNTKIPENNTGLFPEFILHYKYNILTKEITIASGEWIFVQ